jgi:hypothetical protein
MCGLIIAQRTHHQITGEPMKFLTLCDWTGIFDGSGAATVIACQLLFGHPFTITEQRFIELHDLSSASFQ